MSDKRRKKTFREVIYMPHNGDTYYPTANRLPWTRLPYFNQHQQDIFTLDASSHTATLSEATLPAGSLVAHLADYQADSELPKVENLLA